jgi:hypothetical protein
LFWDSGPVSYVPDEGRDVCLFYALKLYIRIEHRASSSIARACC